MLGQTAKGSSTRTGNKEYSSRLLFHLGVGISFFVHTIFPEIRNYRLYLDKSVGLYEISIRLELF